MSSTYDNIWIKWIHNCSCYFRLTCVSKFREFGVQNIKFDENKGVATIEMNNNENKQIHFN